MCICGKVEYLQANHMRCGCGTVVFRRSAGIASAVDAGSGISLADVVRSGKASNEAGPHNQEKGALGHCGDSNHRDGPNEPDPEESDPHTFEEGEADERPGAAGLKWAIACLGTLFRRRPSRRPSSRRSTRRCRWSRPKRRRRATARRPSRRRLAPRGEAMRSKSGKGNAKGKGNAQ